MARAPADPIETDAIAAKETVPRLLSIELISGLLGITDRQLRRLVHAGEFPKPLRVGARPRWPASDYNAYVAKLRARQAKRQRHV